MRCRVCGGLLEYRVTDLPFKIGDSSIVVVKALPVLQCRQCGEIEMEDQTMRRVDQVLAGVNTSSELEVIRFAA
ncbi:MAG TPA: YgiT-type zinc finger protein [Bryobacteraceae bacterium]|jgi:YgiT-type zinc finger domain-containing protein|nr:YgiT-type zinc finger protein [Bryobacteraceae bacterium]